MSTETLPFADLHRRLGARFAVYRGFDSPASYATVDEEYEALRHGCALVDRGWVTGLEMLGEDRSRFLNGLVTCEVKGLEPGHGRYGFLTDVKGRILADVTVLALSDRLWLELPAGKAEEIGAHLRKFVIVDRVEIQTLDPAPLSLVGPRSEELLEGLLGDGADRPREVRDHVAAELSGTAVRLVRDPDLGAPAWTLWVPPESFASVLESLLERGDAGVRPVGFEALERLRVEEGRPLSGVDYGAESFPQETGDESAVSYTKGCYLGQEVVARIHYRGGVKRQLRGLLFAGDRPAAEHRGRGVLHGQRPAGTVTSTADAADGRRLGLAMLHKRVEPGMTVEIEDGGTAEVVALPFTP